MQVTRMKATSSADHCSRLPTSPCYLVCFEQGTGLQWVASARREWRLPDGRPALEAIAHSAGVSGTHVFRLKKAPAMPPGNKTMARLVKIAAKAHGVSWLTAQSRIFWFFDPDNPSDVRRLTAHLQSDDLDAAELRAA